MRQSYLKQFLLLMAALLLIASVFHSGPDLNYSVLYSSASIIEPDIGNSTRSIKQASSGRRAIVTFFTGQANTEGLTDDENVHYQAVRMLGYQIMHQPGIRRQEDYDYVVMVSEDVRQSQRQQLSDDGAVVIVIDYIPVMDWHTEGGMAPIYKHQFMKLRVFQLTQYHRALFLDADMLLTRNIDAIFDTIVSTKLQKSRAPKISNIDICRKHNVTWPEEYLIAAAYDRGDPAHPYNMNAGFYLLSPSVAMFDLYMAYYATPKSFNPWLADQALLNQVHRIDSSLPHAILEPHWNWMGGLGDWQDVWPATIHEKWWNEQSGDNRLSQAFIQVRAQLKNYSMSGLSITNLTGQEALRATDWPFLFSTELR